jgi:hypothetical protein
MDTIPRHADGRFATRELTAPEAILPTRGWEAVPPVQPPKPRTVTAAAAALPNLFPHRQSLSSGEAFQSAPIRVNDDTDLVLHASDGRVIAVLTRDGEFLHIDDVRFDDPTLQTAVRSATHAHDADAAECLTRVAARLP